MLGMHAFCYLVVFTRSTDAWQTRKALGSEYTGSFFLARPTASRASMADRPSLATCKHYHQDELKFVDARTSGTQSWHPIRKQIFFRPFANAYPVCSSLPL
jgi:hypothetical protein